MVCAPSSLLVVAALAALCVDATSINSNPVTLTGTISLLNKRNPAYGGPPSREMVQPVVVGNEPTLSIAETYAEAARMGNNTDGRRKLEATSADVQKLNDYFNTGMDTNVNSIYQKYSSGEFNPPPWPSSYWPTYLDSINYRWTNEISPAEKYARAYGRDVNQFMNSVSSSLGVDSQADGNRVCTSNSQCARFNDGSSCAKRYGSSSGYCVPTWYGICHAWAPAAILEAEPRCNVVKNGVTFHPFDIKALLTAIYDGADVPIVFTGARYDGGGSPLDEYGRYTDPFERDLGAGYFHIAVTNIMGRFGKSFVVDVNADAQVWNQPVRGFNTDKPVIMSPSQAAKTYFNVPVYPFNDQAKSIAYMHMAFRYINEYIQDGPLVSTGVVDKATVQRDYYYLLELDANQNIIGGEWLYGSRTNHPDFLWFATGKPSDSASPLGISYHEVSDLLRQSTACGDPITPTPTPPPGPSDQCGNDQTGPQACPSGQYCQPWNPAFYQCRTLDAKCGKQETGVDYYGDDLATHQLLLPEQCCDKCYETAGCTGYTFVNYNPDGKAYCYLKKGPGSRQSKVGVVSATITTTPTPPPGPSDQCGNDQVGPQSCPSGQYCQPWNPAFYQCRTLDAKCGKQETGVDYYGDDLATHQLLLPEQCCDKCYETAGCTGYTFVNYNADGKAYCYLKKGPGSRQKKVGVVSASITTPPTPPPGPSDQCGNDQVGPQPCPSGQYCQPWNPAFYQCRTLDAKCGKQEVAVDYYGDDIATFQLLLPEDCCDKCYATAGCKAYTFVNYNADGKAYCYLKKGTGTKQKKVGVVSAAITSPTEPASGAQCGDDTTGPQPCATGEYCQPWNPTFYQCRKLDAKCGKQEVAVDYYGDDIATFQLLLPEDCCDKCIATDGCKAYTFVNYNPDGKAYCYLKKGTGTKQKKVGVVSAVIQ